MFGSDEFIGRLAERVEPLVLGGQRVFKVIVPLLKRLNVIQRCLYEIHNQLFIDVDQQKLRIAYPEVGELEERLVRRRGGVDVVRFLVEYLQVERLT